VMSGRGVSHIGADRSDHAIAGTPQQRLARRPTPPHTPLIIHRQSLHQHLRVANADDTECPRRLCARSQQEQSEHSLHATVGYGAAGPSTRCAPDEARNANHGEPWSW